MTRNRGVIAAGAAVGAFVAAVAAIHLTGAATTNETSEGTFIVRCNFSHFAQVDPITAPGVIPTMHMHVFYGNNSTNQNSTYNSMTAATSSCLNHQDTAGYWSPSLQDSSGNNITPLFSFAYYKNIPVGQTTEAFPADFRMIFGPTGATWGCFNTGGSFTTSIPDCSGGGAKNYTVMKLKSQPCWDGRLDSPNHRDHLSAPQGTTCPSGHSQKLPTINFFQRYPYNVVSTHSGLHFSDRGMPNTNGIIANGFQPHVDFWNTWNQAALEALVDRCLHAGINCGQVTG